MEYMDLYNAIWIQAVKDDTDMIAKAIYEHSLGQAYEYHLANSEVKLKLSSEVFDNFKEDLLGYCEMQVAKRDLDIKKLILKEAQDWPDNKLTSYKTIVNELKLDCEDFAIERVKKRMRYLK